MIIQEKSIWSALIFGIAITITSAALTTFDAPAVANVPMSIFNLQSHILEKVAPVYDDFDNYVPYRSDEHDHFSWELLKEVLQQEHKNVVISPFSAKLILAILAEVAGNKTKTHSELISTLTDIRSPDNLRGFYKKILTSLKQQNPYHTLNLETKLYTDANIEPQQKYAAMLQSYYDTEIEGLNFADPHSAASTINNWCQNVTHGRIKRIVNEESIQSSVMVMANVIYFNGLWRRNFNDSYESVFFKTPTEQIKVQYMELTEYYYYYDSTKLAAKILRLPYKGNKFSMFILLPKTKAGLEELTHNLENDVLKNMQWMMEKIKVKVTIPKFRFVYNINLKQTLNQLGITEIFTDNASLPGLARGVDVSRKLKVSNIIQKAGIDVNEKGTEAYASTVVEIGNKFGGNLITEEFNVNRPFIFFIEEEATGNIIFAGKVIEPFL